MSEKTILFTVEEGIGTITLNRPDVLNAFNDQMFAEMRDVLKRAERDVSIRCLVITGAGRAFCAGQDLASLKPALEKGEPLAYGDLLRRTYNPLILKLRTMEKPIIAAINGVAAGAGFSLALACDVRLAAQSARFTQAFVRIGLVPDSGSTFFLPRIVGWTKAIELAMTGEPIDAQTAAELGLVTAVVPTEELQATTRQWAERFARAPTRALGLMKRAFHRALTCTLEEALEYEAYMQEIAGRTADHREGIQAFLEKRDPRFTGQ